MESTIFFHTRTTGENTYMHDFNLGMYTLCHPLIEQFYNAEKEGVCFDDINFDAKYSTVEIESEYRRYLHYKQLGYFGTINRYLKRRFSGVEIQEAFYNTPNIIFEVTDACNLRCKYCCYGDLYDNYVVRANKFMQFNTMKLVIDEIIIREEIELIRNRHITVGFYGGEPLLNVNAIKQIVEYINNISSRLNFQVNYILTTNATLLEMNLDFLVKNNFKLTISIDGPSFCNSYRVFHNGSKSYDVVMKNIILLSQKYPKYFTSNVDFNSVLHNRNSVEIINNFTKRNFNKIARISELSNKGVNELIRSEFDKLYNSYSQSFNKSKHPDYLIESLFLEDTSVFTLSILLYWYGSNQYMTYQNIIKNSDKNCTVSTGTCLPFSRKIFITVNNDILPCEKVGTAYTIGKLTQNGIDINWESVAERYNNYFDNLYKTQCKKCYRAGRCTKCMLEASNLESNVKCKAMHDKSKFSKVLQDSIALLESNPQLFKRILAEAKLV